MTRPGQRRALGRRGEEIAAHHLTTRGARILARNLHLRHAEIDLVALEGETLCIVEVRLRSSTAFGSAAESVDARKRRRLVRAAAELIAGGTLPPFDSVRFDVITIDASRNPPTIEHLRDAFQADR